MTIDTNSKVLIVGLGLLGGCYGMALKKKGFHVEGFARREETIQYAIEHNIIDNGWVGVDDAAVQRADIIVFALYPKQFREWIASYGTLIQPGTLVTDVTGVKTCIVYDIQEALPEGVEFISAHPMAGRETSGIEYADDRIFEKANYIVVPTDKNTKEAIENCKRFGEYLGFARISQLTPEKHDEMIGFLSQLTHCVAVSLMGCSEDRNLVDYTGDSFRDLTRIAKINDAMWSELFMLNKTELLHQMDRFINEFNSFRNLLATDDVEGMREKMRTSSTRRAWFDKK